MSNTIADGITTTKISPSSPFLSTCFFLSFLFLGEENEICLSHLFSNKLNKPSSLLAPGGNRCKRQLVA